jgi:hypothetical protein
MVVATHLGEDGLLVEQVVVALPEHHEGVVAALARVAAATAVAAVAWYDTERTGFREHRT